MSWASHPTTEMPATPTPPAGRHRARRPGLIALVAGGGGLLVLIAVLVLSAVLGASPGGTVLGVPAATDGAGTPSAGGPDAATLGPNPSPAPGAGLPGGPVSVADSPGLEDEVLGLTNKERTAQGCATLRLDPGLATAARAHSTEMAGSGVFGHPGSNGSDPGQRMQRAGYDTGAGWAENIARGHSSATQVVAAWMSSPDHRANILNCDLKALGVGAARGLNGQLYWTQDFGGR